MAIVSSTGDYENHEKSQAQCLYALDIYEIGPHLACPVVPLITRSQPHASVHWTLGVDRRRQIRPCLGYSIKC